MVLNLLRAKLSAAMSTSLPPPPVAPAAALPGRPPGLNWRDPALGLGYLVLHVLLDASSFVEPVLQLGITPWSPYAGLMLAFLCLRPHGAAWVLTAYLLAELIIRGIPEVWWILPLQAVGVLGIYRSAALLMRRLGLWRGPELPRDILQFVLVAASTALLAGTVVVGVYILAGELAVNQFWSALAKYWVGDLNGMLMLTPLLLRYRRFPELLLAIRDTPLQVTAVTAAVVGSLAVVFLLGDPEDLRFFYVLFVPAISAALIWGIPGLLLTAVSLQIGLVFGVREMPVTAPFADLQFLMVTLTLTGLALGVVVTERTRTTRLALRREARQAALFAAAPDAVISIEQGGATRLLNPAAEAMFRESLAAMGGDLHAVLPELDLRAASGNTTLRALTAQGTSFPVDLAWSTYGNEAERATIVIARDASERERAQAQLRERDATLARASRVAIAGELASGLAHELNQPMTALVGYLRAAQILMGEDHAGFDPRLTPTLSKAADEALRAADILRRLRDFYIGRGPNLENFDLRALIESTTEALRRRVTREDLRISVDVPLALHANADRIYTEIILSNLLGNAADAVAHTETAHIRIVARVVDKEIFVTVEDSGAGISQPMRDNMFRTFFTSKPDGMGLGLAVSRSLAQTTGGDLRLLESGTDDADASATLGGARFELRLAKAENKQHVSER